MAETNNSNEQSQNNDSIKSETPNESDEETLDDIYVKAKEAIGRNDDWTFEDCLEEMEAKCECVDDRTYYYGELLIYGIEHPTESQLSPEQIVRSLLKGVNMNDLKCDPPPLYVAVSHNLTAVIDILISNGANVDKETDDGTTAANLACKRGEVETLAKLVKMGANVNHQNKDTYTPLICAASNKNPQIISFLLEHGAEINHRARNGTTAVYHAVDAGCVQSLHLLLEAGALPVGENVTTMSGPIMKLIEEKGNVECARELIKYNCNLDWQSPGLIASHNKNWHLLNILIVGGCNIKPLRFHLHHEICYACEDIIIPDNIPDNLVVVRAFKSSTQSLQQLCRLTIRHTLGFHMINKLNQLSFPCILKRYLMIPELYDDMTL